MKREPGVDAVSQIPNWITTGNQGKGGLYPTPKWGKRGTRRDTKHLGMRKGSGSRDRDRGEDGGSDRDDGVGEEGKGGSAHLRNITLSKRFNVRVGNYVLQKLDGSQLRRFD